MASTNPFQQAEEDLFDASVDAPGGVRPRGARQSSRMARKRHRGGLQKRLREASSARFAHMGFPDLEGLRPVLYFLSVPAVVVFLLTLTGGGWPKPILYSIALALGVVVAISAFKSVELVLACLLIYLPFSKIYVVPLGPGINGTNMLMLLGMFAALLRAMDRRQKLAEWPPGTTLVLLFGIVSALSGFTIFLLPGGRTYFIYNELLNYKAWLDQFIFYFIVLTCLRDTETAKRCVVYMMIGSILVVIFSVPEMLDKMGRSTIEKSRIEGPHLQSNNFGGFVAYTVLPLIAVFVVYIKDLRAWLLTPYFLLTAKVLITTFSRGAYVAIFVGGLMAGWLKGKSFLALWMALAFCFLLVFPSLIPDSITARMSSVTENQASSSAAPEEKLDKSASVRLIMWRAASQMILEDPILGKGFKGFPYLKAQYTETPVEESDPHNMYLYIGAQMGLPALSLFLLILGYSFYLGRWLSKVEDDQFIKAIGIGGASATVCFAVVCIFGSRAVSLNFTVYFWAYLVVMQVLKQKRTEAAKLLDEKPGRSSAFARAKSSSEQVIQADGTDRLDESLPGENARAADVRSRKNAKRKVPTRGAQAHLNKQSGEDDSSSNSQAVPPRSVPLSRAARRTKLPSSGLFGQNWEPRRRKP